MTVLNIFKYLNLFTNWCNKSSATLFTCWCTRVNRKNWGPVQVLGPAQVGGRSREPEFNILCTRFMNLTHGPSPFWTIQVSDLDVFENILNRIETYLQVPWFQAKICFFADLRQAWNQIFLNKKRCSTTLWALSFQEMFWKFEIHEPGKTSSSSLVKWTRTCKLERVWCHFKARRKLAFPGHVQV